LYLGTAGKLTGTSHTVSQENLSVSHTPQESNHPAVSLLNVFKGAKENTSNKY
jgi:hypothetical protein